MASSCTSASMWQMPDIIIACKKLSSSAQQPTGYNPGALTVAFQILGTMGDSSQQAQFCANCERLDVRSWKLYFAYKHYYHEDKNAFVQAVLRADEAMLNALKEEEKRLQ